MTGLALVSAKGAPGVTTSALLLTALWPSPACLLEADPAGGDLRFWQNSIDGAPLRPDLGMVSLLAAYRAGAGADHISGPDRSMLAHCQQLPGGLPVLVGAGSPAQHTALGPCWPLLTASLQDSGQDPLAVVAGAARDVAPIVDAGRLLPDEHQSRLLTAMSLVLVVCRPTISSVAHTRDALASLRAQGVEAGVLVIGTPTEATQTQDALGLTTSGGSAVLSPVYQLPDDPAAARSLAGDWTRKLDRSPLVAAGRRLAAELHSQLHSSLDRPMNSAPFDPVVFTDVPTEASIEPAGALR